MKTHITFVLDSSGSMAAIEDDTVGGFNAFLDDQREEEGCATVTLYDFNTTVERVYQGSTIEHAPELKDEQYTPGGRTALHDAISVAVTETLERLAELPVDDRPETVIVVVLTDGKENASETPHDRVREQVEHRRDEHGWEFLFIGANQDAALTASKMGMDEDRSLNMAHNRDGARAAYESTSNRISDARREGTIDGFADEDRDSQDDARRS